MVMMLFRAAFGSCLWNLFSLEMCFNKKKEKKEEKGGKKKKRGQKKKWQ